MSKKNSALEEHGWVEVAPPTDAQSWDRGTVVIGSFNGMNESTFENEDGTKAILSSFSTDDGDVMFWTPSILRKRLEAVTVGTLVKIECVGKIRLRSGHQAWDFKVFTRG